ncbi:MAG: hypothetical protein RLZ44_940 [Pseudomonadota bacterium]
MPFSDRSAAVRGGARGAATGSSKVMSALAKQLCHAVVLAAVAGGAAWGSWDPGTACALMAEHKLPARGGYRALSADSYRCASARRPILAGDRVRHEIRYYATGSAEAVTELTLELHLRDSSEVQRAYRLLLEYTEQLFTAALHTEVPAPLRDAILGGTTGQWPLGNGDVRVERTQAGTVGPRVLVHIRQP